MWKPFTSSLTRRVIFQVSLSATVMLGALIYVSLSNTSASLKKEIQLRVNQQGEALSLIFNNSLERLYFDTDSFAQRTAIKNGSQTLSNQPDLTTIGNLAEYTSLKEALIDEQSARDASFIAIVNAKGQILAASTNAQTGKKLSINGYVDEVLKSGLSVKSFEIIPSTELTLLSPELLEQARVDRRTTEYQKTGWRDKKAETDGLFMTAVSVIKKDNTVIGAVVSGILMNNDMALLESVTKKSGGIATIYLYDARIATTQTDQDRNETAKGTLASEDVVNAVYVSQNDFSGRSFEVNDWYLMSYIPLRDSNNEVVGSIARGIIESEIQKNISGLQWRYVIMGGIAVMIVFIVTSIITRQIVNSLKKLAANAYRISRGNLDIDIKAPDRDDEIGDLTHSFIIMKDKLLEYYTKLEDLVAQRTQELRQKVKDLEHAQHSIEREKNKSESILANVGDGVMALDENLTFIACNEAAVELFGYTNTDVIGKQLDDIIVLKSLKLANANKEYSPIMESIKTGQIIVTGTGEYAIVNKAKKEIPVTITAAPLIDAHGVIKGGVVVLRDVTKEQEIDKMKSEFVSVASHQLRTPLSASKWFLEMLLDGDAGKLNDEQREYLDHTYKSNERMIALVNDLLNVSRIESGTIAIEPTSTDMDGMVKSVLFELTPLIKQKNIKTVFKALPGGTPKIKIDSKLIRQVFQNLLSNAVKYTPESGTTGVRITKAGKYLQFEIFDSGVGIPKVQQSKVFKKFFRADNVITLQTEGTGLGLYVAKSVVDASGGKIWFTSNEGQGTSFFFTLPLAGSKRREGEKTLI